MEILLLYNYGSLALAKAAHAFLMHFHLAKDAEMKMLSYAECEELAAKGELKKLNHWWPRKDGFAFVVPARFMTYRTTVDEMRQSYSDFCDGWNACMKSLEKS